MKQFSWYVLMIAPFLLGGCNYAKYDKDDEVISKRYIHKYGYDVSKAEWDQSDYPGHVVTTLRNGVTITSSYANGMLNGETTMTHPHSQILESSSLYEKGTLIKKIYYDIRGVPVKEETYLSPSHKRTIQWYKSGTPMSTEEYHHSELLEAEYYNKKNETEYKVTKGEGTRIKRNEAEVIHLRETISHGYPILRETFYSHGVPHMVIPLLGQSIHGEKKVYAPTGEPISIESYYDDILHGTSTYYQNGCVYLEVNYQNGLKHGVEKHFVDGQDVVEETEWHSGQKHGPSTVHFDGMSRTRWYYNNQLVSKEKYHYLCSQEENIAIMNERALGHPIR